MSKSLVPLTKLQEKAVEASVTRALKQEMEAGRKFDADSLQEFIREKTQAITGSSQMGMYAKDHAPAVDKATTEFIQEKFGDVRKHPNPFGGSITPIPTVPLVPVEDKGRLI